MYILKDTCGLLEVFSAYNKGEMPGWDQRGFFQLKVYTFLFTQGATTKKSLTIFFLRLQIFP